MGVCLQECRLLTSGYPSEENVSSPISPTSVLLGHRITLAPPHSTGQRVLPGPIVSRSYMGNHRCYEGLSTKVLPCPEVRVLDCFPLSLSQICPPSSVTVFPELWKGHYGVPCIWVFLSLYFDITTAHCTEEDSTTANCRSTEGINIATQKTVWLTSCGLGFGV